MFIYALADPDTFEIRYVGKAVDFKRRYWQHQRPIEVRRNVYRAKWIKSILKRGMRPIPIFLESVTEQTWREAEVRWIASLREQGCRLTNIDRGGEGGTPPEFVSEETRRKLSEAMKGRRPSEEAMRRSREYWTGRKLSAEHIEKLRQSHMGYKRSAESIERQRQAQMGHVVSEETRRKISESNKGKGHGPEWRKAKSESMKGKPSAKSEEALLEMSKQMKGNLHAQKHRGINLMMPDGSVVEISTSIPQFAKEFGYCRNSIYKLIAGKLKTYRGMKLHTPSSV